MKLPVLFVLIISCTFAAGETLPECEHDTETLFYNAYVDLENLPAACNNGKALLDIGFIIQDSFEEVDMVMRSFAEERVHTQPCPFPNVDGGEEAGAIGMRLRQPNRQPNVVVGDGGPPRYQATGRADRCNMVTSTPAGTRHRELDHEDRNDERFLQEQEICTLVAGAERDANLAQEAVVSAELVLQGLKEMNDILGSRKAANFVDKAESILTKAKSQRDKAVRAQGLIATLCQVASRGQLRSSSRSQKQAEKQSERASAAAEMAEKYMLEILDFEKDLVKDLPDPKPTEAEADVPSTTDMENAPLTASQQEYIDRLKSNIESSNTKCAEVANAMLQKTLAEESVRASNVVYDEIKQRASTSGGDARVERVKAKAAMLRRMVKEEAEKASAAADRASDLCAEATQGPNVRRLEGREALLEETENADAAVLESRVALLEEKRTEQDLDEVLGLIEFEKNEFYQLLAPETSTSPSLFYAVRSGEVENVVPSRQLGKARSKAEWLQDFGNMLVSDIFTRILLSYNPRFGGCVMPGSGFGVAVNITELQTVVDEFLPAKCPTSFLARDPVPQEPVIETNTEPPNELPEPSSFPSVTPSRLPTLSPTDKVRNSPFFAPSESPSTKPSGSPSAHTSHLPSELPSIGGESFGIIELVLVDADRNKDIHGALDCSPVNDCWGSGTSFSIRATVFGSVEKVKYNMAGPINWSSVERKEPRHIFGGKYGNADGKKFPPGVYTVTAQAINDGVLSQPFTKTFTVSSEPSLVGTQSQLTSAKSFGVQDLILVDADRNEDIPGALDCNPINDCWGSGTSFSIRATVFGSVKNVKFGMVGPINWNSVVGKEPRHIFGDYGTDAIGKEFPPGMYTVTALADNDGLLSQPFTKTFMVGSDEYARSFGIQDLILVDADRNEDILGALECNPVDDCWGSCKSFSIRAVVFGYVKSVKFAMAGPINWNSVERKEPRSVFGKRNGIANGKKFPPGVYTVTAQADNDGALSQPLTKTFTVGS